MEYSCLHVFDYAGSEAPKEVLSAAVSSNLQDGVFDALKSNLSSTATRVVLLHYAYLNHLNFEYIGTMGYALDLDPRFFITHFHDSNCGRLDPHLRPPSLLPLDTSVLQFRFIKDRHITICVVQNVGKCLIIRCEIFTTMQTDSA